MLTEISLAVLFLSSAGGFWYLISRKLPELIAIPEHTITERFGEESARFRLFLLHFKSYFTEGRYKLFLANLVAKFLQRLHIVFMRMDNTVVRWQRQFRVGIQQRVGAIDISDSLKNDTLPRNSPIAEFARVSEATPPLEKTGAPGGAMPEALPVQNQSVSYGDAALRVKATKRVLPEPAALVSFSDISLVEYRARSVAKGTDRVLRIDRKSEKNRFESVQQIQQENLLRNTTTLRPTTKEKPKQEQQTKKVIEEDTTGVHHMRLRKSKIVAPEARG